MVGIGEGGQAREPGTDGGVQGQDPRIEEAGPLAPPPRRGEVVEVAGEEDGGKVVEEVEVYLRWVSSQVWSSFHSTVE